MVPCSRLAVQVTPQSIAAGVDVTVPAPSPDRVTVRVFRGGGFFAKVAATDFASFIVT